MAAPTISAITTVPNRENATNQASFSNDVDTFFSEVGDFQTEANAQASYLDDLAVQVDADAVSSAASAAASEASAAAALVSKNAAALSESNTEQLLLSRGDLRNTGEYQTGFNYLVSDIFFYTDTGITTWYLVNTPFTSSNILTDLSSGKVQVWQGLTKSNGVAKIASVFDPAFANLVEGQAVELIGYHPDTTVGGGSGVVKTARHNGGTAISLSRAFPAVWGDNSTGEMDAWFADSGSDELCFVRLATSFLNDAMFGSKTSGTLNVVGCAVSITSSAVGVDNTFAIIDDSEHDPINCTEVNADSNSINVTHIPPAGSDVVGSCIVAPDETLAKRGIYVGASIGTGVSVVTMSKRHSITLDWAAAAITASDLIIDGFIDPSRYLVGNNIGTTGAYRINHPATLDGLKLISAKGLGSPDVVLSEVSGNTTDLYPYKTVRITAKRVGGTWKLTGGNPTETTALNSLGFSVTDSSNIITITHPSALSVTAQPQLQWVGVNTYESLNVLGRAPTSCTFVKIGSAGSASAPIDGDEFYVTLHEVLWEYGYSNLDIGIIELNPLTDFKDISSGNNFWLLGNHWATK